VTEDWRHFEFGVGSIYGYQKRNKFPHPVETYYWKIRDFGVQEYKTLQPHMGAQPSNAVADLHTVAVACFLADRHYPRDETGDGWTRRLRVTIPVVDPAPWNGRAGALFTKLLEFLTSDEWELRFKSSTRSHVHSQSPMAERDERGPSAVSLFSAGLDSFCHNAIATATDDRPRFLVGHSVPNQLIDIQKSLSRRLPGNRHTLVQFKVEPRHIPEWNEKQLELSQRTRTLLFMGTALLLCEGVNAPVLEIPENGLLALNPPLNVTRTGAGSTKSVHPMTLHLVNSVLGELGTQLSVENPVAHLTKGELCGLAADVLGPEGLPALAATVSCSSMMPGSTRNTKDFPNCGWCYPCLVRHASLEAAGGDSTRYEAEEGPAQAQWHNGRDAARKALRRWLEAPFGRAQLLAAGPLPPSAVVDDLLEVVKRSREELRQTFG
jgi:hypothetical protein